jgi:hypothetical protein
VGFVWTGPGLAGRHVGGLRLDAGRHPRYSAGADVFPGSMAAKIDPAG